MQITFYGAAGEVTGSCHLLEIADKKILIDCGMFQGGEDNDKKNYLDFDFDVTKIDAVLMTHAHLDHVGKIPKLVKDGFSGPIYSTKGTRDLARLIWDDALHIMEYNERKFKKIPVYTRLDVDKVGELVVGLNYKEEFMIDDVRIVFKDAGHIFGASFIEITGEGKTVAFSGDIGNINVPILRETDSLGEVDALVCESTYGNRFHESREESKEMFVDIVKEASKKKGTIIIPAFSLERTQELLYDIHSIMETDKSFPRIPIYLDSPLAIRATEVYRQYPEYYDDEAKKQYRMGDDFLNFPGLIKTESVDESKTINDSTNPKMIIAGSGMMTGGRILHHAKRYLSQGDATIIFIGYQAKGTLGRRIYEGEKKVKVDGAYVEVNCTVRAIGGLSAHGDQNKLVNWIGSAKKIPLKVCCVHGESEAMKALGDRLKNDLKVEVIIPTLGQSVVV